MIKSKKNDLFEDLREETGALYISCLLYTSAGCNGDAPGSFAAWLSQRTPMYAYRMPGKRFDVGDVASYEYVQRVFAQK